VDEFKEAGLARRKATRGGSRSGQAGPHDLRRTCARLCHTTSGELEQIHFCCIMSQSNERYLGCKRASRLRLAITPADVSGGSFRIADDPDTVGSRDRIWDARRSIIINKASHRKAVVEGNRSSLFLKRLMSDYNFNDTEQVAIWRGDGEKCFYCRTPVPYSELQVDHIVPEKIPSGKLTELVPVLPANFEINSIQNWVTCHQGCNIRKSAFVFETNALLYYIQMASKRAEKVQKIMDEFEIERQNGRLLSTLKVRIEKGQLDLAAVLSALGDLPMSDQTGADPWIVAFGANFLDSLPEGAPEQDPELSDWLLERLERDLASTGAIYRKVDDERSGEGISVRCAFWILDLDRIIESIDFCWDVLTVQRYSEVFDTPANDLLDRAVVSRYHEIVHNAPGDPVGISACPGCGSEDLECASFSNEEDTFYEAKCRECGHRSSSDLNLVRL